jgi:drug/metabolite transporter (DMT)-like permease
MKIKTGSRLFAHMAALLVIAIWASTFVSSKILLRSFSPVEVMLFRILIAYIALWAVCPQRPEFKGWRQELLFAAAGFCGVTLYFMLQNVSLTYSTSSNVAIVLSLTPMLTAVLAHWLLDSERLMLRFFAGFLVAGAGVLLVTLNGNMMLKLNPLGDILAFLAGCSWALYCVIMRKIMATGHHPAVITRKVFFYGLVTMLPFLLFMKVDLDLARFADAVNLFNLLFLALGASAFGFIVWNWTVGVLGAVKTNGYLYLQPVATMILSAVILDERITLLAVAGIALTLAGLAISERKRTKEKQEHKTCAYSE